jgi:hypothetical protein
MALVDPSCSSSPVRCLTHLQATEPTRHTLAEAMLCCRSTLTTIRQPLCFVRRQGYADLVFYIRACPGKCSQPINRCSTFSCSSCSSCLNLLNMGNSESVIVSRHDRKHKSSRRRERPVVSVAHEYFYREGHQHVPSSDSYVSSRRSKRRVRYPESKSSSDSDVKRPSGVRFADDYSQGGRTAKDYIVDHGYVVPGNHPNTWPKVPVKQNPLAIGRLSTGPAFDSAKAPQRPPHNPYPGRSQFPKSRYPPRVVPLKRHDSADQPSRHYYSSRS